MFFEFSHIFCATASSSDAAWKLIIVGLIVLAIICVTCYSKGRDSGYSQREQEENDIYQKKLHAIYDVQQHACAIETFRKNCSEWISKFGDHRMAGRGAFEKIQADASQIINAINQDILEKKFSFSLKIFTDDLDARKEAFTNWCQDERLKLDASIKLKQEKINALMNETENAKIKVEEQIIEARKIALNELNQEINKLLESAISDHPSNAYIAGVLTMISETLAAKAIAEINEKYKCQAPITASKAIHAIHKKFNESVKQWHYEAIYYKFQTALYESLFPQLLEYSTIGNNSDGNMLPATTKTTEYDWLSNEEYATLSSRKKSQLALDRYIQSPKSKWQVGRDYELFVGYKYRCDGWKVEQFGVERKLEDMGRDLICRKIIHDQTGKFSSDLFGDIVEIQVIQCKFWSSEKIIHEKHIAQLFGTTIEYAISLGWPYIDKNGHLTDCIKPVFVTTASLSETARRFAEALSVEIKEDCTFDPSDSKAFPRIKCNLGKDGEKIYHLPFDQQYDVTKIDSANGDECWAFTVDEAENKGYRRAMRWMGD